MHNIESELIAYLTAKFPLIPVGASVPPTRPDKFITVEQIGGNTTYETQEIDFVIGCTDSTRLGSSALAIDVYNSLFAMSDEDNHVCKVEQQAPTHNPTTDFERYTINVVLISV